MSYVLDLIIALLPLIVFLGLYIGFFIWGNMKNKKMKTKLSDDLLTSLDPYIENYSRKDPNDRQIELRCQLKKEYPVRAASYWVILLPRSSMPTIMVDKLIFRNRDAFGLAANFHHQPKIVFELIPYRLKSAIRKDFNYLVELDDIETENEEVNSKFLIKSNKPKTIQQLVNSPIFISMLTKHGSKLQWVSVRTEEPHYEFKFEYTGNTKDIIDYVKFSMVVLKYFAKVAEKTKDLPLPEMFKKDKQKLDKKEKEKKEKEKEKYMKEREKRKEKEEAERLKKIEKSRKEAEKTAKKQKKKK